jgi:hypothetical protein
MSLVVGEMYEFLNEKKKEREKSIEEELKKFEKKQQ